MLRSAIWLNVMAVTGETKNLYGMYVNKSVKKTSILTTDKEMGK